jgi:FkbM family methyltransferase
MRAASAGWPRWIVRQLLMPARRLPLTIRSRTGVASELGDDPVDDSIFRHIHGFGQSLYFPPLSLDPTGIVLDVGAHHGIYAMEALRRYPRCDVVAVEPDPDACLAIERNARLNQVSSRLEIVCAGLADRAGRGWLERDPGGSWGSRTRVGRPSGPHVAIELLTLEAILRGRTPAIVKCNAEGAEFTLVPQLIALGLRPSLIVLMTHPEAGPAEDLVTMLTRAGYGVHDADTPSKGHRFHCVPSGQH